ncbi:MAG: 3'-5' exonuclease, partial [Edaphobacter sp.]
GASAVVAQNTQRKGKTLWTSREGGSLIGYYEAPDGENEALFIADRVQRYLREAGGQEESPRCAVLYRTNSQSRLIEEALRRYGIQYHMVGGFSFYDRAEVKDILSYMKLVLNVHDSVALGRVVNSPARGIGKTTMETLERMALSSGMSTWDAIGLAIEDKLLPQRALIALGGFRRLIEDARAMLGPGFAEKLAGDLEVEGTGIGEQGSAGKELDADDVSFGFGAGSVDELPAAGVEAEDTGADTSFDTSFNFGFDFGPSEEISTIAAENASDSDASHGIDAANFNPFAPVVLKKSSGGRPTLAADVNSRASREGSAAGSDGAPSFAAKEKAAFRKPGDTATLPELIKFLNDRSGYIRVLEGEGTPEAFSRIENLKELANAAHDAQERGESLHEFLDHAALVSDADSYSEEARVTLMTLHAAKGLEFPLVFLTGMEEGLFPSGRTMVDPAGLEEERRLCYVGMTRAMDTLVMTRARYRRRYGSDMPDSSIASRFLEEVPSRLVEDLGSPTPRPAWSTGYGSGYGGRSDGEVGERHYSYEDEDQSGERTGHTVAKASGFQSRRGGFAAKTAGSGQSMDNIASFFARRGQNALGQKLSRPKLEIAEQT